MNVDSFLLLAQTQTAAPTQAEVVFTMIVVGLGTALLFFFILRLLMHKKPTDNDESFVEDDGIFGRLTPGLANVLPESEKEAKDFRLLLRQAGFYKFSARNTIYALRLVLFLIPFFLGLYAGVIFPDEMPKYAGIGFFVGAFLSIFPRLYVYWVRKNRIEKIRSGIADTMDMFAMCASGGMTMNDSLEHVAEQLNEYPELTQELRILRRQIELGSLEQACADLIERNNIPEMRQFSYLLLRSSQLGNQTNTSLNEQADHLRAMRRHHAMEQANKTPTKLVFPLLFCFAPGALIILIAPSLITIYDFMMSKEKPEIQENITTVTTENNQGFNFNIETSNEE